MNTHHVDLVDYCAKSRGNSVLYLGTAGSHGNEQLDVTLGEDWAGLTVQVIFHPGKVAVQLPADGLLDIPWEATAEPLTALQGKIVFQGFSQDRLVNTIDLAYTVADHSSAVGRDEEPYTPGIVEGVLNRMAADKEEILGAARQARQAGDAASASAAAAEAARAQAVGSAADADAAAEQVQAAVREVTSQVEKALIRPVANGSPAVCTDSLAWKLQGLSVYGKSTQDGTPDPENPMPITTAGASGSILLEMTDGADQHQSFTISTPNGLAGIPVEKEGNYTDANGQHWISDIKNFVDGNHYQNTVCLKNIVFDYYTDKVNSREFRKYNLSVFSLSQHIGISNKFICRDADQVYTFSVWGTTLYVRLPLGTSIEEANRMMLDAVFLYAAAAPIVTRIPDEERAACSSLMAYAGTTVVSTDEPVAGVEVQYVADGTKYLKSVTDRIAALEKA